MIFIFFISHEKETNNIFQKYFNYVNLYNFEKLIIKLRKSILDFTAVLQIEISNISILKNTSSLLTISINGSNKGFHI